MVMTLVSRFSHCQMVALTEFSKPCGAGSKRCQMIAMKPVALIDTSWSWTPSGRLSIPLHEATRKEVGRGQPFLPHSHFSHPTIPLTPTLDTYPCQPYPWQSKPYNKHPSYPIMAAPQLPVPNIANLQAAVNGMTATGNAIAQNVQTYHAHQQTLNTELSRCGNYNVAGIQQQCAAIQASIADSMALSSAQ